MERERETDWQRGERWYAKDCTKAWDKINSQLIANWKKCSLPQLWGGFNWNVQMMVIINLKKEEI